MEFIQWVLDMFLHLDKNLAALIQQFGVWTYLLLFVVVFCETGLVVTPFLPGDSLLFAAGALCTRGDLDPVLLSAGLIVAAIAGDAVNYMCGAFIGPKVFCGERNRFFKREHLERTQRFYERHGGKTIIIARFVPIIRTFAPFVAGVAGMSYPRFFLYNVVGGVAWVLIFIWAGYAFGNIPAVQENFGFVALGIIFVSILPLAIEWLKARNSRSRATETPCPTAEQ